VRVTVLKSSGRKQAFQAAKIARTVRAAGAGATLAKLVARSVAADIREDLENFAWQLVPTSLIKRKVIRHLALANPRAARRYAAYRKQR
jgi:transcriptional regulator NrdR family protein